MGRWHRPLLCRHREPHARRSGDLGDDDRSVAVIASVVGPPAFFALRGRGYSSDSAVALTLELVLPWLDARRDQLAQPGSP